MDAFEALFGARIPKDWLKKSWEAATLGSWFAGLLARHDQLAKWLLHGRPKSFWLTGFFNPQVRSLKLSARAPWFLCSSVGSRVVHDALAALHVKPQVLEQAVDFSIPSARGLSTWPCCSACLWLCMRYCHGFIG